MNYQITYILILYGVFLIGCGVVSVIFIGMKAKTALVSGGTSGIISIIIAYLVSLEIPYAQVAGIVLPAALFCVFSWRSTLTLFKVFELIPAGHIDLKGKGIAFLIISLMAVVSLVMVLLQLVL